MLNHIVATALVLLWAILLYRTLKSLSKAWALSRLDVKGLQEELKKPKYSEEQRGSLTKVITAFNDEEDETCDKAETIEVAWSMAKWTALILCLLVLGLLIAAPFFLTVAL